MSLMQNRWFRRFGFGAIAAIGLCTAAMTASPAQAHEFGYRGPAMHHAAFFPRIFFGGGYHHWHHWDHWGYRR